jgi:xanthine dehydrogenase accessory factor
MTIGTVVIRGGGDLGTGVAHRLFRSGFKVVIAEMERPLVIRRKVAFAQAVFDGETAIEGVKAVKVDRREKIDAAWEEEALPVVIDPDCQIVRSIGADVLVDARLAKRTDAANRNVAPLTVGLGPGLEAGNHVDVVVETKRGHNLGKVIFEGCAEADTGIPEEVMGWSEQRVLRAPCDGVVESLREIGDVVKRGDPICSVGQNTVSASIDGVVRGIIMNRMRVTKGFKIGDIDPRGIREYCFTISDKARAVGGGVLEAILYVMRGNHS